MNRFEKALIVTSATVASFGAGVALDSSGVHANQPVEQGIYPIPSDCTVYPVGYPVSKNAERALAKVGFTGINPDGLITNKSEQGAVKGAQEAMEDMGVIGSDVKLCGYAGNITEKAAKKMLNPSELAGESQISFSSANNQNSSRQNPNTKKYTIDDCKSYDVWSVDTIKAVQRALGVRADGIFGSVSCNAMINFQEKNGIAQYGKGFLGSRTLSTLGVENPQKISSLGTTASTQIDIDRVVIDKSDNILKAYDNGKLVSEDIISHGDDRTYTYSVDGRQYTGRAITRTGTTTVYRTEGADYASKTLGGNPGSMGYARFFNGGLAVHVGNVYSASHGCVRVTLSKMKNLVQNGFGLGDTVTVQE